MSETPTPGAGGGGGPQQVTCSGGIKLPSLAMLFGLPPEALSSTETDEKEPGHG